MIQKEVLHPVDLRSNHSSLLFVHLLLTSLFRYYLDPVGGTFNVTAPCHCLRACRPCPKQKNRVAFFPGNPAISCGFAKTRGFPSPLRSGFGFGKEAITLFQFELLDPPRRPETKKPHHPLQVTRLSLPKTRGFPPPPHDRFGFYYSFILLITYVIPESVISFCF